MNEMRPTDQQLDEWGEEGLPEILLMDLTKSDAEKLVPTLRYVRDRVRQLHRINQLSTSPAGLEEMKSAHERGIEEITPEHIHTVVENIDFNPDDLVDGQLWFDLDRLYPMSSKNPGMYIPMVNMDQFHTFESVCKKNGIEIAHLAGSDGVFALLEQK